MSMCCPRPNTAVVCIISYVSASGWTNRLEHLSAILKNSEGQGSSFVIAFMKQAAMRIPKVGEPQSRKHEGTNGIKSLQRLSLKPMYTCVECSEKHSNGDRQVHTDKTNHLFCEDGILL